MGFLHKLVNTKNFDWRPLIFPFSVLIASNLRYISSLLQYVNYGRCFRAPIRNCSDILSISYILPNISWIHGSDVKSSQLTAKIPSNRFFANRFKITSENLMVKLKAANMSYYAQNNFFKSNSKKGYWLLANHIRRQSLIMWKDYLMIMELVFLKITVSWLLVFRTL